MLYSVLFCPLIQHPIFILKSSLSFVLPLTPSPTIHCEYPTQADRVFLAFFSFFWLLSHFWKRPVKEIKAHVFVMCSLGKVHQ